MIANKSKDFFDVLLQSRNLAGKPKIFICNSSECMAVSARLLQSKDIFLLYNENANPSSFFGSLVKVCEDDFITAENLDVYAIGCKVIQAEKSLTTLHSSLTKKIRFSEPSRSDRKRRSEVVSFEVGLKALLLFIFVITSATAILLQNMRLDRISRMEELSNLRMEATDLRLEKQELEQQLTHIFFDHESSQQKRKDLINKMETEFRAKMENLTFVLEAKENLTLQMKENEVKMRENHCLQTNQCLRMNTKQHGNVGQNSKYHLQ